MRPCLGRVFLPQHRSWFWVDLQRSKTRISDRLSTSPKPCRLLQIKAATAANPVRISVGMLNRTPGSYINAYTSKGTVYVAVRGRALIAGPFAVPKAKTVLRAGTAVRQSDMTFLTVMLTSGMLRTRPCNKSTAPAICS